jgi:uncharacterized protein YpuA (DUF1002 family)
MKPEELIRIARELLAAGYENEADDIIDLIPEDVTSTSTEDQIINGVLSDLIAHNNVNLDKKITAEEVSKIENSLKQILLHPIMP